MLRSWRSTITSPECMATTRNSTMKDESRPASIGSLRAVCQGLLSVAVGLLIFRGDGFAATEYYVSPNGSNDNPGTEARPFRRNSRAMIVSPRVLWSVVIVSAVLVEARVFGAEGKPATAWATLLDAVQDNPALVGDRKRLIAGAEQVAKTPNPEKGVQVRGPGQVSHLVGRPHQAVGETRFRYTMVRTRADSWAGARAPPAWQGCGRTVSPATNRLSAATAGRRVSHRSP